MTDTRIIGIDIAKRVFQLHGAGADGRFAWPAIRDGVMRLSRAQFAALFAVLDWRRF
ncbi:MAG: hypothetical protein AAGG06_07525 [Pseudomonadota bacterium]